MFDLRPRLKRLLNYVLAAVCCIYSYSLTPRVVIRLCDSVCDSVRTIKPKRLKLKLSNLAQI